MTDEAPEQRTMESDLNILRIIVGRAVAPFFTPVEGKAEMRAEGRMGSYNARVEICMRDDGDVTVILQRASDPPHDDVYSVYFE
ncbi:hypothetical protein HY968_03835 [Candidatus Kaiserbacteria bacterium]|nr:hypothetical protein [Candidatus Kaiserbacteria bacterium]